MNKKISFNLAVATLSYLALTTFSIPSQAELNAGKAKYRVCSACHGVQGQGGIGPALGGKSSEYIVDRLRSYKAGEQIGAQSALMWGQAAMLTELDIVEIAEYLETLDENQ